MFIQKIKIFFFLCSIIFLNELTEEYLKNNFNFFSAFFCYLDKEGNTEEESDADFLDSDVSDDSDASDSDEDASDVSDADNMEIINDEKDVSIFFCNPK